ncbi:hypothetical protein FRACYDRAFT_239309 [Fragilariopsis cylindrus CCMP1102]|uniref:Uncharacterized protein n=1 Tax=Fragilariopsis cylindrus CCMP1102 TaxID=635003 RepID=A0A1E7FF91_9STRA|nr:hypothetical protein FRACYDRAFT_239309 [Fragilariopsis cylindrus CCMP1102]|eukprot:OEU16715.1 hypothetical protein FRACYDRAFT_239309 [Fragilariopsis cylindrus CCMP1102]
MSTAMITTSPRRQRRRRRQLTIDELYDERQTLRKEWMEFLDSMDSDDTSYEENSIIPGCNVLDEIITDPPGLPKVASTASTASTAATAATAATTTATATATATTTTTTTTTMSNEEILQIQSHLDYDYDYDCGDNDNDSNDPAYRSLKEQVDQLDEIFEIFSDLPNMNNNSNNDIPSPTGTSNDAFEEEWKALDKLESDLYKEMTECDINVAANSIKSCITSKDDDYGSYHVKGNNSNTKNDRGEQQQQQIQQQKKETKTATMLNNNGDGTTSGIITIEKENNDDSIRDDIVVCVNDCNGGQQQQQQLEYECVSNDLLLYATKIMTTTKNRTTKGLESESPVNSGSSHGPLSSSSSTAASNTATALKHNDLLLHAAKIMTTTKNKTIEEPESESQDNSESSHSRLSSSSSSSTTTSKTATALKHMRRRRRRSSFSSSNEQSVVVEETAQPTVVTVITANSNSESTVSTTELLFTTRKKARNDNNNDDGDGEGDGIIVLVGDNDSCIVNIDNDDATDIDRNAIFGHNDHVFPEGEEITTTYTASPTSVGTKEEEEEEEEEQQQQQQQQIEQVKKKNINTTPPSDHDDDGDDIQTSSICDNWTTSLDEKENEIEGQQHHEKINLIEYRTDNNDSAIIDNEMKEDIIGTDMIRENIDQKQQDRKRPSASELLTDYCCTEMCAYGTSTDTDVLDYVFENVESFICATDAAVPRSGVDSPTGEKELLLPVNTNNMLVLKRDNNIGDLLGYCFEHVESYVCTSSSFDEEVDDNWCSKSVLPSPTKKSASKSKSLQQVQQEWDNGHHKFTSLLSNSSMYKQDLSTISEVSFRKEQPPPCDEIADTDADGIESWSSWSSDKKEEEECAVHRNSHLPLLTTNTNSNTSTISQVEDYQKGEGYELMVNGIISNEHSNEPSLLPSIGKIDEEIVIEAVYGNVSTAHDEENDDYVNDLVDNRDTSSGEEERYLHQQPQQHQQQVQTQIQNEQDPISPLLCKMIVHPVLADIPHQESRSIQCRSNSSNSTHDTQCSKITPAPATETSPDKSTTMNNSSAPKSYTIRPTPSFDKPSPSKTKVNELNNEQQFFDDRNDFSTVVVTNISSITVEEEDTRIIDSSPGFGRDSCDIDAAGLLNQILLEVDEDVEDIELPHNKMSVTNRTVDNWQDQKNDNGYYAVSSNNSVATIPTVVIDEAEEKQFANALPPPSAAAVPSILSPNLTFELDDASSGSSILDLMTSVDENPFDESPQKQESKEHDGAVEKTSCAIINDINNHPFATFKKDLTELELEIMNTTICGTAGDGEVSPLTTPVNHLEEQQEQKANTAPTPTPTSYTFFSNNLPVKKSIDDDEDDQEQNDDIIDVVPIHDDNNNDDKYCAANNSNNNSNNTIIHTNKSNESQDSSSSISQVLGRVYARIIKGNNNKNGNLSVKKSIDDDEDDQEQNDDIIDVVPIPDDDDNDDNYRAANNDNNNNTIIHTNKSNQSQDSSSSINQVLDRVYARVIKGNNNKNGTDTVDYNDGSNDGDASTTKTTVTRRSLSPTLVGETMKLQYDGDEISSLIGSNNQKLLDSIANQDYDTYSKMTSNDITGIDCYNTDNSNDTSIDPTTAATPVIAPTMIIEGRSACWNKMIFSTNNKNNRPIIKSITTTRPTVRKISSDVIVLVYSRYDHHYCDNNSEIQQHQQQGISGKNSAVTASTSSFITTSNETRIWKKIRIKQNEEEKWVNFHFHRSISS